MSYLVLARKWRPKNFGDVVGQGHVIQALQNALAADRVHHAYLFAGTRGVGKTTIARILAKALNCEAGVVAEPCGKCASCLAVDEGRFVDLIEVDAASRTGVDDTRELLENVQYTPTSGRYKVYLIDEVHMLSRQSFNALLKTLEEPPPHVKFLLATTDPQKLPVTVLSRCLQFNLKRLPVSLIEQRVQDICKAEGMEAEPAAVARLARAAAGSVRDALSLLDQALAYGDSTLRDTEVAAMLGTMDRHRVVALVRSLVSGDAGELLSSIEQLDEDVPDYERVLDELATVLQRIAVVQLAGPEALADEDELDALVQLAGMIDAAQLQLYYQIAIMSRRDLPLAPEPRLGFEMTLLRMLAFRPGGTGTAVAGNSQTSTPAAKSGPRAAPAVHAGTGGARQASKPVSSSPAPQSVEQLSDWPALVAGLGVSGAARQLAENCCLVSASPFEISLRVEPCNEHLITEKLVQRLTAAVQEQFGTGVRLNIGVGEHDGETLAARQRAIAENEQRRVQEEISNDPKVKELVDIFGAELVADSVRVKPQDAAQD
ncbi:MAG TPA: DNA polymerase III subunit gamma/tau [Chromatiales bacterium]|nr:DNA polymerase III subunit gamma/tau [Chromatiales bacterium]